MTRSTHTIEAQPEIKFTPAGFDGFETAHPRLMVEFSYLPGDRDFCDASIGGPGGWSPGWSPGSPAEVDFISATLVDGDGLEPDAARVADWAREWLDSDEGYRAACEEAAARREPDPDAWYDAKRSGDFG